MFPSVGQSFLAGLRGALGEAGLAHEIHAEPVGVCGNADVVSDRIQRLLLQRTPAVVTGIMGSGVLRHVHAHFSDAETPFIVNDLGGDPLMTGGTRNPFVFGNTLHLWQSMYALGEWAARTLGRRACVAAALHEAGYGIVHAFWLGFCEAGGGEVVATEVTHRETADDDPLEQVRRLSAHQPDVVMAFYAGREGIGFAKAWTALGLAGRIPLLASPLMTHDLWRSRMPPEALDGLHTAWSWDTTARPEAHTRFSQAAGIGPEKEPAVFALLGYETGQMIVAARQVIGGAPATGAAWRNALSGVSFASPRGELHVDADSGEVVAASSLFEWHTAADGRVALGRTAPLARSGLCDAAYQAIQAGDSRSGWLNPYLVT